MGYTTHSTRIRRATTASVRFTPRALAAYVVARTRALATVVAELFRAAPAAARAATPSAVVSQTERAAAPVAAASTPTALAPQLHRAAAPVATALAQPRLTAELHRRSSPSAQSATKTSIFALRESPKTFGDGTLKTYGSGETKHLQLRT